MKNKKLITIICLSSLVLSISSLNINIKNTTLLSNTINNSQKKNNYSTKVTNKNNNGFKEKKSLKNNKYILASNNNLNLNKSSFWIYGDDGVIAERISFNNESMKISKSAPWGDQFEVQLISGTGGKSLATSGMGNDNLNGQTFSYGDVVSLTEGEQLYLAFGKIKYTSPKGTTTINSYNSYANYVITKNGLKPVENKNLTVNWPNYSGTDNMIISGKTFPNRKVYIYCKGGIKTTTSNEQGKYSLNLKYADAPVRSEIRVFVNSENNEVSTVQYNSKIKINSNEVVVSNNDNVPVLNIGFDPINNQLTSYQYAKWNNYTGDFDGENFNMKLLNPTTGEIIKEFKGKTLGNRQVISKEINGTSYKIGDILEIETNPKFVPIDVKEEKKILSENFEKKYYQITESGLIAVGNDFINYSGINILGDSNYQGKINITGKINPNEAITVTVEGKKFTGKSDSKGIYNIELDGINNLSKTTQFTLSAKGYINTIVYPKIDKNINIEHSFINFYNNNGYIGNIALDLSFNPVKKQIICNTYGGLSQSSIGIVLMNQFGKHIYNRKFEWESLNNIENSINNQPYQYGDIIGINYNANYSIPTIISNNKVMGNIDGKAEYFEITTNGLVPVKIGDLAMTNSLNVTGETLTTNFSLAKGQSKEALDATKKLILLNSSDKIISTGNSVTTRGKDLNGSISLNSVQAGKQYQLGLKVGNKIYKIIDNSNIYGNDNYLVQSNSDNVITINKAKIEEYKINKQEDIEKTYQSLGKKINSEMTLNNINNLSDSVKNQIIEYNFINKSGVWNLEQIYNMKNGNQFINWILNNHLAMNYLLEGTEPGTINLTQLTDLYNIYNTYTDSRWGFNLKLAVAISLAETQYLTNPVAPIWGSDGGNPVERYEIFSNLNREGAMLPLFNEENIKYLMTVVKSDIPNSQIMLTRATMLQNHNALIKENQLINTVSTMSYNMANPFTGVSVFNGEFYGNNPSINTVWADGGVCGAIAKISTAASTVFGVPATPVGQPEHCAFVYYDGQNWEIGNDIYGWSQSSGGDISGWSNIDRTGLASNYDILYNAAIKNNKLEQSDIYLDLANSLNNYDLKLAAINKAIDIDGLNLEAFLEKINLYKNNLNVTREEYNQLANTIMNNLKAYPMPMVEVLAQFQNQLLQLNSRSEYNNLIEDLITTLEQSKSDGQPNIAEEMLKSLSNYGFIKNNPKLLGEIYLNNWGSQGTVVVKFINGQIKVNGLHKWIGTAGNSYLEVNLYNSSGTLIKEAKATGEEFGDGQSGWDFSDLLNNTKYSIGDYITVNYEAATYSKSTLGVIESDFKSSTIGDSAIFKITNNQLEKLNSFGNYYLDGNNILEIGNGKINIIKSFAPKLSVNNITVKEGSQFKNSILDPKVSDGCTITYSGLVNTKVPGDYFITVTAENKYGLKTSKIVKITVKALSNVSIKDIYYDNNSLIINGFVENGKDISVNDNKIFEIVNSDGSIVDKINTIPVNWYSKDKNNYAGFQVCINDNLLLNLEKDNNYKLYLNINGKQLALEINKAFEGKGLEINNIYNIANLKVNKIENKLKNSTIKYIYFDGKNLVINGNVNGENINVNIKKEIIIKDLSGKVIECVNTVPVNWYSKNQNNYSGYQVIFNLNDLKKLNNGEEKNIFLQIDKKVIPINIKNDFYKRNIYISNFNGNLGIKYLK